MTAFLLAHGATPHLWHELWRHWRVEPITAVLLLCAAAAYVAGLTALWMRAGVGRGIRAWEAGSFAAGLVTLAAALLSPLAWVSEQLFSAHMTQHEILMLVSAPLLVFGRPLQACHWALPAAQREATARWTRGDAIRTSWRAITGPGAAFVLHAGALWIWHVPALYEAALGSEAIHAVQHVSFVVTAALFWWGMLHGRYGRLGYGVAVLYVFLTAVHSSVLGALMTIAPSLWYPSYAAAAAAWRVDALADQQLAGLLMWVPSGVVFIVFGLALLAAWLGESERRVRLGSVVRVLLIACVLPAASACTADAASDARRLTGGEPDRGKAAIERYGCGSCHQIPGVRRAGGTVGPPLTAIARRAYLGGQVANTPQEMMRWIRHPQQIEPGTAMPDLNVTDEDARHITAYLYTLR